MLILEFLIAASFLLMILAAEDIPLCLLFGVLCAGATFTYWLIWSGRNG